MLLGRQGKQGLLGGEAVGPGESLSSSTQGLLPRPPGEAHGEKAVRGPGEEVGAEEDISQDAWP